MHKKQGVTLISLVIAAAIITILTAVTIVNVEDISPKAKKVKIAEEFEFIEDKIKEYYLTYGNYPVANNTTYTKEELIAIYDIDKRELLAMEITKNGDDASVFFLVDLEKLGVVESIFGKSVAQKDFYVASSKSEILYYPAGISLEGNWIFSTRAFDDNKLVE